VVTDRDAPGVPSFEPIDEPAGLVIMSARRDPSSRSLLSKASRRWPCAPSEPLADRAGSKLRGRLIDTRDPQHSSRLETPNESASIQAGITSNVCQPIGREKLHGRSWEAGGRVATNPATVRVRRERWRRSRARPALRASIRASSPADCGRSCQGRYGGWRGLTPAARASCSRQAAPTWPAIYHRADRDWPHPRVEQDPQHVGQE
jgi:hypothetical protein